MLIIIVAILLAITAYNFMNIKTIKHGRNQSVPDFIRNISGTQFTGNSDLNIIIFVTPLDCRSCTEQLLTKEFLNEIKAVISRKKRSVSISYVVSGDYAINEKNAYLAAIQGQAPIYIDKTNKVKEYLNNALETIRTPLILIISEKGTTKYWQTFEPDPRYAYERVYQDLIMRLEMIL